MKKINDIFKIVEHSDMSKEEKSILFFSLDKFVCYYNFYEEFNGKALKNVNEILQILWSNKTGINLGLPYYLHLFLDYNKGNQKIIKLTTGNRNFEAFFKKR